jgi:hypothetical protein
MTAAQRATVERLTASYREVHHGDCVGADADMHEIARARGQWLVGHPPSDSRLRAWCDFDEIRKPKPFRDRNHDIVDETGSMVAAPAEFEEQLKGGTWGTVRYARSKGRPIVIVRPDGTTL